MKFGTSRAEKAMPTGVDETVSASRERSGDQRPLLCRPRPCNTQAVAESTGKSSYGERKNERKKSKNENETKNKIRVKIRIK